MRSRVRSGPAFAGGGALLVLLALAVGACGGDGDAAGGASSGGGSSKAGGDYVLGGMTDQSGAFAANGVPQLKGFMGAIEVLNADGGIDGHKVRSSLATTAR